MTYDDAAWHYDVDSFPEDLPIEAGGTHIGMFLGWLISQNFLSDEFLEDFAEEITKFKVRQFTGTDILFFLDGKFSDDLLNDEGNAFTTAYYRDVYLDQYPEIFSEYEDYRITDTWENYDRASKVIDENYNEWLSQGKPSAMTPKSES